MANSPKHTQILFTINNSPQEDDTGLDEKIAIKVLIYDSTKSKQLPWSTQVLPEKGKAKIKFVKTEKNVSFQVLSVFPKDKTTKFKIEIQLPENYDLNLYFARVILCPIDKKDKIYINKMQDYFYPFRLVSNSSTSQTSISQDEQHLLNIASKASDQLQPEITDLSKILEFSQKLRRHITSAQQSKARFSVFTSLKEVHDRIDAPSAKLKQLEKEIKPELIKIHEDLSKTVEKDNSALSSIKAEFQSKVNFISEAQQIDSTLGIMTQACNTRNLKLKQILTFFSQLEEGFKKADNTNKELKEKLKEKHQNINLVTNVIQQFNIFIHELESILGKLNSIEEAFKEVQNIASRYNLVQNFNKIQTRLSSYQKAA
jgi:hypothetical protein